MAPSFHTGVESTVNAMNGLQSLERYKSMTSGKAMTSVFRDAPGIIFIDNLQKRKLINSDYYIALLELLDDEIAEKQSHLKKNKMGQ